jgi:tetratricopeptide (TPR) repeat protein
MIFPFLLTRKTIKGSIAVSILTLVSIYGYLQWKDYQSLEGVKVDFERTIVDRDRVKANTTPQTLIDLGNSSMTFWKNAEKGMQVANHLNESSLAWLWLVNKPKALNQAVSAYKQALALQPDSIEARVGLCHGLIEQGETAAAIVPCRQAVEQQPQTIKNYLRLGYVLNELQQGQLAETTIRQAIALEPNNAKAYHLLGKILWEQGKKTAAVAAYRHAIELDPHGDFTEEARQRLENLALPYLGRGERGAN